MAIITRLIFGEPPVLSSPAPWAGHIPFAFWLLPKLKPQTFVELGSYSGISYFSFCEAALQSCASTVCYAIDTWQGDEHAGIYDESVYSKFLVDNERYKKFSTPLRCNFDEALLRFEDNSIDLLHIDGLHTYEAVRHDFESWKCKLTDDAVVLFHDTEVTHSSFGVHRYWQELKLVFKTFEFKHSNGLGILFINPKSDIRISLQSDLTKSEDATLLFSALGERFELRAKLIHTENLLADALCKTRKLTSAVCEQGDWITKLDLDILEKDNKILSYQHAFAIIEEQLVKTGNKLSSNELLNERANTQIVEISNNYVEKINNLEFQLRSYESLAETNTKEIDKLQRDYISMNAELVTSRAIALENQNIAAQYLATIRRLHSEIDGVYTSLSWNITKPLRYLNSLRTQLSKSKAVRKLSTGISLLTHGHFSDFFIRAKYLLTPSQKQFNADDFTNNTLNPIGILFTPHTFFYAKVLEKALCRVGLSADLIGESYTGECDYNLFFVICPQMHRILPPPEKRICFQMEQSVSERWFTKDYISLMENSLAVADYSTKNLEYLDTRGIVYPHTFFVPVGTFVGYDKLFCADAGIKDAAKPKFDLFFYGDVSSPRRQAALAILSQHFSVRLEKNLFGQPLYEAMMSCSVVINIHYYENALLETTRLCECISMGMPVVSESSIDILDHPLLSSMVSLFPLGDMDEMVRSIKDALSSTSRNHVTKESIELLERKSQFYLYRMLKSLNVISFDTFYQNTHSSKPALAYALSLPETFRRRRCFSNLALPDVELFDGVRNNPGWVGCALSYKYLAKQALTSGQSQLLVMEDDVRFSSRFREHEMVVRNFLNRKTTRWDVFSGLMAKIHPDTKVLDVEKCPDTGLIFVTIDRMMSMVYNIYRSHALDLLSKWDQSSADPYINTVDEYLQKSSLRVVTTIPFLVAHDELVDSSLWGFSNSAYKTLISEAELTLQAMVNKFTNDN